MSVKNPQYLHITSMPCSMGWYHASLMALHVVASTPRFDGGSGGFAVLMTRLSDLAVSMKALTVSCPTELSGRQAQTGLTY